MCDLREYLWDAVECEAHGSVFRVPDGKPVEVTDPCYDRDVWCRTQVDLPAGEYVPFMNIESGTGRVAASGICRDTVLRHCSGAYFEECGDVGVDAGLMGFFIDKPNYTDSEWQDLCKAMGKVFEETGEYPKEWETAEGFFTESGWGDGCYPVFLIKDALDTVCGVMVVYLDCYTDFDDEDDEEEDEEEEE